jgi:hypothetical protein
VKTGDFASVVAPVFGSTLMTRTFRHAGQCEHRYTSDPALLRAILKVRDGAAGATGEWNLAPANAAGRFRTTPSRRLGVLQLLDADETRVLLDFHDPTGTAAGWTARARGDGLPLCLSFTNATYSGHRPVAFVGKPPLDYRYEEVPAASRVRDPRGLRGWALRGNRDGKGETDSRRD